METTERYVAYYRVSTEDQGRSGLGLEAQEKTVHDYLKQGKRELAAEFKEVESGGKNDRPELKKALQACRIHQATLLVAKLDRLARNVYFISSLMEAKVDFVACDFPTANRLTLHILAAVAENEREMISKRTKEALAAAKERGVKLGSPNPLTHEAQIKGAKKSQSIRSHKALERAKDLWPTIESLKKKGITSLSGIAKALNEQKLKTPRQKLWRASQVKRLLQHLHKHTIHSER